MCEHLLSLLHIQKLGHYIEEIRVRALSSVISKYNLNLVDESNLENTKLLLEKLLDWFNFDKYSEEEKVFNLILRILKYENSDLILKEVGVADLSNKLLEIEKKVGSAYSPLIQNIKDCISKIVNDSYKNFLNQCNLALERNTSKNKQAVSDCEQKYEYAVAPISKTKSTNQGLSKRPKRSLNHEAELKDVKLNSDKKAVFRIQHFPWHHLTVGDKQVMYSVYEGLRYIDNTASVIQSCQFYNEVLLRDFPTEIFIQRPLIVRTFMRLIENAEKDVRLPALKSLKKTVQCLKKKIQLFLKPVLFHSKKEYYSTCVFPKSPTGEESYSEELGLEESLHLNLGSVATNSSECDDDADYNDSKYQLSLPDFYFEVLHVVLPLISKKSSQEETNLLIVLIYETLTGLISNIRSLIWPHEKDLQSKFYKIFGIFQEAIIFYKKKNHIFYFIFLCIIIKLLNSLKPPSGNELDCIIPKGLQLELGFCVSDANIVFILPNLHSEILNYVQKLPSQKSSEIIQDFNEFLTLMESMKSSIKFTKNCDTFKTKMEKFECGNHSIASLDFHQYLDFVQNFFCSALFKYSKTQLKEDEMKIRDEIFLKLLAHSNDTVKIYTYNKIKDHVAKTLGVEEAVDPKYEFLGDKIDFLFCVDVLTEIICHGLNSNLTEVRRCASEIISHLLKSKFLMAEQCWNDFINALIPCLSLLECFADKSTNLGRIIVKMFDPDIARTTKLPEIEVLKGNIRLLFSKNNLTRDEAVSRLFWLLSREDRENVKLPRMNTLTGLNLSGICCCVKPREFDKIRQSFYSPGRLNDVMEMLSSDAVEPNLRRSALSQICVMMDDIHLHSTFLEQDGLSKVLKILDNCLIEKEYRNYPDSVLPIIDILKILSLHNASIRQELSTQIDVLYNILRGLFLFNGDETLRQNAVELLCLLLYSDCILRVPSNISIKCTISFPEIVVTKMCLPFFTHIHWRSSRHYEPSTKKVLMSKQGFSKLIRICWAVQWLGGVSNILAIQDSDIADKTYYSGILDDIKITLDDIKLLRNCSFSYSVKQTLFDIQNATTHDVVSCSIHKLQSYFLLYNIEKNLNKANSKDISSDTTLSHMLWETTLERFMTSYPTCTEDENLLLQVIRFIQVLLKSFKSERLIKWIGKLLVNDSKPCSKMIKNIEIENFGPTGRELRLAIIELTQEIVTAKTILDRNKWFLYMKVVSNHLKLENKEQFNNVAFIDWLLSLLADLTGKWDWDLSEKTAYYQVFVIRIVEIIIAFHCTKDSAVSFMGSNIIKNSLFVLNHLLKDAQVKIKGWEKLWNHALSKVFGHKGDTNYCWLLSLWFMRDSITRAAAFQLFVGFSATPEACDLLVDRLGIQFDHIWAYGFKVLCDENECCFVREKSALLLCNLICHGAKITCEHFFKHLEKINFYEEVRKIICNFQYEYNNVEIVFDSSFHVSTDQSVTTPSFVTSVCILMNSLVSLDSKEVTSKILESGIMNTVTKLLVELPDTIYFCEKNQNDLDILKMYTAVCRLIKNCVANNWTAHSFFIQSEPSVNTLFSVFDYNLFCITSCVVTSLKFELWTEILHLFSILLLSNPDSKKNNNGNVGFLTLNKSLTNNGIDNFISSLYIAITSPDVFLRESVLIFLINFFGNEILNEDQLGISDIFHRKISSEALKLAIQYGWKALNISKKIPLYFGICMADVLHRLFLFRSPCVFVNCKTMICNCLGSLFAVCQKAQDWCSVSDFAENICLTLKEICVNLNLESLESFKKLSIKKKIDPQLSELETLLKLTCNLILRNEKAKTVVADCALSAILYKMWPWCSTKLSLHVVTLKTLCNFTRFCDHACRTLVLSSGLSVLSLKKFSGSITLMNAIMNQITVEMDLILNTNDTQVICLCLQVLTNCCRVTECRSVISKGNFFQCFCKLIAKKKSYNEVVKESWLIFFIALSSYQEGQLVLTKSQDLLDTLISFASSTKGSYRIKSLTVLRNICFHPLNRMRLLIISSFLSLILHTIKSENREEVQTMVVMLWALSNNTQKVKSILRHSGVESELITAKRHFIFNEDRETADLIQVVIEILSNK